jgi:hypothetical protein
LQRRAHPVLATKGLGGQPWPRRLRDRQVITFSAVFTRM